MAEEAQRYYQDEFLKMKPERYLPGGEASDRQKIKRGFIANKMIDTMNKKLEPFVNVIPPSLGFKEFDANKFQIYGTQGASALGEPLAEGGIAGLSGGDKSGPPPERGPNSEGLSSLLKRGTNI